MIMGNCFSESFRKTAVSDQHLTVKRNSRELTLAIVGLDKAGKTTVAKCLKGEKAYDITPTVGFTSFAFKFGKFKITIFDLGGGAKIRGIWRNYYAEVHGLIYIMDASDHARIGENKEVLSSVLQHSNVKGKPVLLFLNKQDVPGALDEECANEQLGLEALVSANKCPCRIAHCAAAPPSTASRRSLLDPDLRIAFQWLLDFIASKIDELSLRIAQDLAALRVLHEKEKAERMERIKQARLERGEPENGAEPDDDATGHKDNPFKTMEQVRSTLVKPKATPVEEVKTVLIEAIPNTTSVEAALPSTFHVPSPATPNGSSDSGYKSTPPRPKTPQSDDPGPPKLANSLKAGKPLPAVEVDQTNRPLPPDPVLRSAQTAHSPGELNQGISELEQQDEVFELSAKPRSPSQDPHLPPIPRSAEQGSVVAQTVAKRKRKRKRLRRVSNKLTPAPPSEDSTDSGSGRSSTVRVIPLTPRLAELPSSEPRPPTPLSVG